MQGPDVPIRLHGSLNKNVNQLLWESPMFTAELRGRFIQEVGVRANEGFPPAMSCLIAYVCRTTVCRVSCVVCRVSCVVQGAVHPMCPPLYCGVCV